MTFRTMPRRLAAITVLSLTALAACGGDADPAASGNSVEAPTTTSGMRPATPIEVTGGMAGGTGATQEMSASTDRVANDMAMIAPTYVADFVVADGLGELPTVDTGFLYEAGSPTTADDAAALAAQLGVAGEPVRVDEWEPGGWQVGPTDGTAPALFLSDDPQHSWSYSPAWVTDQRGAGCAVAAVEPALVDPPETVSDDSLIDPAVSQPTTIVPPDCEPQPPAGILTADEATARADALMEQLGVDTSTLKVEPYADEWSASVTYSDVATGRYWGFGFGAEGALQWANGTIGVPVPVGPYPLIDLDTAIARLKDQQSSMPMPIDLARTDVVSEPAVDSAGVAEPAVDPVTTGVDIQPMPAESFPVDSYPVVSYPAPEPITVTLVDVEADVWWAWAADGSVWLVPAYRFIGDDGGWYTVPAVTDEYLVEVPAPEIPVTEPATEPGTVPPTTVAPEGTASELTALVGRPLDEFTAAAAEYGYTVHVVYDETTGVSSYPEPEALRIDVHVWQADGVDVVRLIAAVHETGAASTVPAEPTDTVPPVSEPAGGDLDALVGLPIEEFTAGAETGGWTVRVTEIDGVAQPGTMDYRTDRVNVAVVTNADGGQTVKAIVSFG